MKKIFMGLLGLIAVGIVILSIQGSDVREIKTEIQISAPIDQTWNVLTNINAWTEWNPTVNLAEGEISQGSKLNITIAGPDGKDASNYQPTVVESNTNQEFRWTANMMANFIFKNDRVFTLTEKDGGTYLVHKEEFSGLMVPLMWKMMQGFVGPTLEKMNQALKEKLENQ